jgi:hypothetical protein
MNRSYNEIQKVGKCTDYKMRSTGNTNFWVETWQVDKVDYFAIFSDHPNATLPMTITIHDFLS